MPPSLLLQFFLLSSPVSPPLLSIIIEILSTEVFTPVVFAPVIFESTSVITLILSFVAVAVAYYAYADSSLSIYVPSTIFWFQV